jgi:hypothetical protein
MRPVPFKALSPGTVVYARIPFDEDSDRDKSRPAVVVSATKQAVTVLPITSKGPWSLHGPQVPVLDLVSAGLTRASWARMRAVVIDRCYVHRVLGRLTDADLAATLGEAAA